MSSAANRSAWPETRVRRVSTSNPSGSPSAHGDEAQLRLHPRPLTVKPGIRVGCAPMGLVAAPLTLEIHRGVALATLAVAAAFRRLFRPEALHRRPAFDQSAIDREMLARQQTLDPRLSAD